MSTIISVKNVGKYYKNWLGKKHHILNDINFEVNRGEIVGLIGTNGTGKSTLMRMIAGISYPTSGDIYINSENTKTLYDLNIRTKIFYSSVGLNIGRFYKVKDIINLYKNLNNITNEDYKELKHQLFTSLKIKKVWEKRIYQLSTGEKQKIFCAFMLMSKAEIYFLDEPTFGLDIFVSDIVINTIKEIHKKGKTIIIATHSLEELLYLNTKIMIINNGGLIEFDEIRNLLSKYNVNTLREFYRTIAFDKNGEEYEKKHCQNTDN